MKSPILQSEVMHQLILGSPKDAYAQILRHCPFVQLALLREGYMTPDELTPKERERLSTIINLEDLPHD